MINLNGKKVFLTGPQSMIGRATIVSLRQRGAIIQGAFHEDIDLMDYQATKDLMQDLGSEYCIHLAGYNGNIAFNSAYPADIFFRTSIMGQNVLRACAENKIKKVVSVLSSCGYKAGIDPLKEEEFLNGEPDPSTEAHAYGKRDLLIFSKLLKKQFSLNATCCILNTVYGPYDNFELNKTKVVGSFIKKFTDAVINGDSSVTCWGTGNPQRELIYCADAAEGIVQVLEKYDETNMPINIGFNHDIRIGELAKVIANLCGFKGEIVFDSTKPDGQTRKILNSSKMVRYDISINETFLENGLRKTIEFYKEIGLNK